ncbi:MAG TPA: MarR family transcriptional regulator, partial [Pseudonocardiaceae bacterium]
MPRATHEAGDHSRPAVDPAGDSVDDIVTGWAVERPDLRVAPVGVITRFQRLRTRFDEELTATFARFDLSPADFSVIAALRRSGPPFTLGQSVLMGRLRLTSGTVSIRLARLESKGVVSRTPNTEDSRGVLVTLTELGQQLFDQSAPVHLANEDILLSALTDDECDQLVGLLRKLLVSFEHERSHNVVLGVTVASAHVARRARTAVGLSDRAGLLVQQVDGGGVADRAGLAAGDLLVGIGGHPLRSYVDLAAALARPA